VLVSEAARRFKKAGDILGFKVLEHIIIGDGEYLSFVERGGAVD
jgi:DNA repair protein RadC